MNLKKILILTGFFFMGCFDYYPSPPPKEISHNEFKNIVLSTKQCGKCNCFLKSYYDTKGAYSNLGHEDFNDNMTLYHSSLFDYSKNNFGKGIPYQEMFYFNSIQTNLLLEFDTRLIKVNRSEIFTFINMSELELKSLNNRKQIESMYRKCFALSIYGSEKNKRIDIGNDGYYFAKDIDQVQLTFKDSILNFYFNEIISAEREVIGINKIQLYSVPYKNNKKNGLAVIYFYDGSISAEINYKDDVADGESKRYYKNGQLKNIIYYDNGKLNGNFYSYYKNGTTRSEINFIDDQIQGYYKEYYKNGNIRKQILFQDGNITENIKYFHENGNILYDIPIKNNKRYGIQKDYYESGELHNEHHFIDNDDFYKILKISKQYSKNGKLLFDIIFDKKIDDYIMRFYYESGNIKKTYTLSTYSLLRQAKLFYDKLGAIREYAEDGTLLRKYYEKDNTFTKDHKDESLKIHQNLRVNKNPLPLKEKQYDIITFHSLT